MVESRNDKADRILGIYTKLIEGGLINKAEEAERYGVDRRSIQRDIDDIRNFLATNVGNGTIQNSVVYDHAKRGYRLDNPYEKKLTNSEVLALSKILLDSRAFVKKEMQGILDKLIACCVPENNQKLMKDLIRNAIFHYIEPRHKTRFLDMMWEIGQAIYRCRYIEIDYFKLKDKSTVKRKLKPVALMFSEYYFYLAAFIEDEEVRKNFDVINDSFPTIYRIDRIKKLKVLEEKFRIPYRDRFEEGEFRKRIQFMYGGRIQRIRFRYFGLDIDAVLDRLPTAKVLSEENGVYTVSAEVFGKGIDMWLRGQGEMVQEIKDNRG